MFTRTKFLFAAMLVLCLTPKAHAWGGLGHQYVARLSISSLSNSSLKELFTKNADWLATASSHPDRWRNRPDAAEAARHFLDGERFGIGLQISKLPTDFAVLQKLRSYDQLRADGVNPWTVKRIYQLLMLALKEKRWEDAFVQAAYLSHYVADAHVPFHASENYDGQLTTPPQRGIHARFEEKVLERSIPFSALHSGEATKINDPTQFLLTTLEASLGDVASILAADRKAQDKAQSNESDAYWTAFIEATRPIAIRRLETGGRALAGLYEKAWREAGRPTPPVGFTMTDRLLPYAAPFTPRGTPLPPAQPVVTEEEKSHIRSNAVTLHLYSEALGGKFVPFTVLLPKNYYQSDQKFSVLYLLHGAWGKHSDWNLLSGVAAYAKDLPLIIVMPDSNGNGWYQDSIGLGNWQQFFEKELMPQIEQQFRTINSREGRALTGLSMGGYGAWKIGLDNPKKFCAVASLSGALTWGEGDVNTPGLSAMAKSLFPMDTQKRYASGALWPRLIKKNIPALYFDCGKDDFLVQANRSVERRLLENNIPYEYAEFDGAHTWPYWDAHIRDALNFVLRHVSSPRG
jgi:putative tributyrin esterase